MVSLPGDLSCRQQQLHTTMFCNARSLLRRQCIHSNEHKLFPPTWRLQYQAACQLQLPSHVMTAACPAAVPPAAPWARHCQVRRHGAGHSCCCCSCSAPAPLSLATAQLAAAATCCCTAVQGAAAAGREQPNATVSSLYKLPCSTAARLGGKLMATE